MIKTLTLIAAGAICAFGSSITTNNGDPGTTPTDLFDIANGTVINSSSPVIDGYDIRDMFGGTFGTGSEQGVVLFKDINTNPWPVSNNPADYFVTFTTAHPVSVAGFTLYLADDFNGTADRTVSKVQFFEAGNPTALANITVLGAGQTNYLSTYGSDNIQVNGTFQSVTASTFTIVLTSNPLAAATSDGPRVFELDAVAGTKGQNTPEPSTLLLASAGILGLLITRKLNGGGPGRLPDHIRRARESRQLWDLLI